MSCVVAGPAALPISHVEHCMGTVFSFRVPAPGVDRATLDATIAWLHAMDAMFSTYRPDSEISRLNDGTLSLSAASAPVRQVLADCARYTEDSAGFFSARPDGGSLNPSGYVKGWAIQRAADMLAAAGATNFCINGGGDVVCAGRPQIGRGWRIGICDPFRRGTLFTTIEASGPVAVATSGLAERGAHIIDPHTGRPATELASVTVLAADLITADVYATSAVAMGASRALTWLADKPDVHALLVTADGGAHHVGGWREHEQALARLRLDPVPAPHRRGFEHH